MQKQFSRTGLLLGAPAMATLAEAHVAVFGVGGVGGYVVEVLARSGVGAIDIIDDDDVSLTNINRQIIATMSTVGQRKVDVAEARIHDINPECKVTKIAKFYLPQQADEFDFEQYDYVVDCIDTVTAKLGIISRCHELNVPVLSCLGAGYKLDATLFRVTDLFKTINDPLAKIMRKKLRKTRIRHVKVVYSPELPLKPIDIAGSEPADSSSADDPQKHNNHFVTPPSNAWVPAVAGMIAGGEVVKDIVIKAGTMRKTE